MRGRTAGFALLGALWASIVLGLLAGAVSDLAQGDVEMARSVREQARAEAAAEGAAWLGLHALLPGPDRDERFQADGRVLGWRIGDVEYRLTAEPENWRLDLNTADETDLTALLAWLGLDADRAAALAAAIADFRDPDQIARPNGAEDPDYRRSGTLLGAKDAPFEAVEEVARVLGMDADLYRRVLPHLTVFEASGNLRRGGGFRAENLRLRVPGPAPFTLPLDAEAALLAEGVDQAGSATVVRVRGEAATRGGARAAKVVVAQIMADGGAVLRALMPATPALFP